MKTLALDSTVGGLGDIWMRLIALYSLAGINGEVGPRIRIPKNLLDMAKIAFPDRIEIESAPIHSAYQFSHLGLRHLLPRVMKGERFACPFTRILQAERKKTGMKDVVNDILFELASAVGKIKQPTISTVQTYQGFHEFSMFPELRAPYSVFMTQASRDFLEIRARLIQHWPKCKDSKFDVLVFPGGSAHQIMPPSWAKMNLPLATYAFFAGDVLQSEFEALELPTQSFGSAEELLDLASAAIKILVTDSFPSHIIQTYTAAATVLLTEQVPPRTVHPAFDGIIVPTAATCAPCKHIARGHGSCAAGHEFCITWSDPSHAKAVLATTI